MITLAAIAAQSAAVATKSATIVHGLIPPIGTPGFKSFPLVITVALALMFALIFLYEPRKPNGSEAAQRRRDW